MEPEPYHRPGTWGPPRIPLSLWDPYHIYSYDLPHVSSPHSYLHLKKGPNLNNNTQVLHNSSPFTTFIVLCKLSISWPSTVVKSEMTIDLVYKRHLDCDRAEDGTSNMDYFDANHWFCTQDPWILGMMHFERGYQEFGRRKEECEKWLKDNPKRTSTKRLGRSAIIWMK
jgi:hypothetical protein